MTQTLRDWIELVEAAHLYGSTFWFNPATKETISCSDHGDAVAHDPYTFGIDSHTIALMTPEPAEDDEAEYSDDDPQVTVPVPGLWGAPGGWGVNDAWEQLAMNRGWVRVGTGHSGEYATYLSGSTAMSAWQTAKYMDKQGLLTDALEIEISRETNSLFLTLGEMDIDGFLRISGRAAENYLAKLA